MSNQCCILCGVPIEYTDHWVHKGPQWMDHDARPETPDWDEDMASTWAEIDLAYTPQTVCVVHLRFVPCRSGEPDSRCCISTQPEEIAVVRRYQDSNIGGSEAHRLLDELETRKQQTHDREGRH